MKCVFSPQFVFSWICKHTSMVCFISWWLFCRRVVSFLAVSASLLLFFFVLLLWCKFHRMTRFKSISHSPQSHLKFRFFNQTRTLNFAAPSTEAKSPSLEERDEFHHFGPSDSVGRNPENGFLIWLWFFLDTEVTNSFILLYKLYCICKANAPAKIPVPLTRFIVNWTPGVLSLEYYHQLFDTRLSFWMNNPCHLQILQITRSCRFMSLALIAFKGQACSETHEYRNTFSSCRHLSTEIL